MKYLIAFLGSLLLSTSTVAAQQAVLLGPDLEPVPVWLESLSPSKVRVTDAQSKGRSLKPEDVLRLTLSGVSSTPPSQGQARVALRDGQVIVGYWGGGGGNGESVSVTFGDADQMIDLPLDEITSIVMGEGAAAPAAEDDDVLFLANGEKLTGFVESMGAEALEFVVGDADDAIKIPLERVKAVSIANKPKPAELTPGAVRVTTADGSVLYLEDALLAARGEDSGKLVGDSALPITANPSVDQGDSTAASSRLALPIDRIVMIEPVSSKRRLSPLSDYGWRLLAGGEVFGVEMPPRVGADGTLRLHAPTTLGYDLPQGASRLVFTVAMEVDESIPESRRQLAGCDLVVYEGDRVLARHALSPDGPAKHLNLPLAGGGLRLAIEPGVNGPVLDRVTITRAEVLVSE